MLRNIRLNCIIILIHEFEYAIYNSISKLSTMIVLKRVNQDLIKLIKKTPRILSKIKSRVLMTTNKRKRSNGKMIKKIKEVPKNQKDKENRR